MLVSFLLGLYVLGVTGQNCPEETLDCNQPSPSIYKIGDQDCTCDSHAQAGSLKYAAGKAHVCIGSEWKALGFEATSAQYGTQQNPGSSCKDILSQANYQLKDGVYWISLQGGQEFPVYCDMLSGGWTMVFKAVSGVSSHKVWPTYNSASPINELVTAALDVTNQHSDHYVNRIVTNSWNTFNPSKAKVVAYEGGITQGDLIFDAVGSDKLNWFASGKIISSPWADVETASKNYFSIQGHCQNSDDCRAFFISHNYHGCPSDTGWLVISDTTWCPWENTATRRHHVLYSKLHTKANWNTVADIGIADVLAVFIQ